MDRKCQQPGKKPGMICGKSCVKGAATCLYHSNETDGRSPCPYCGTLILEKSLKKHVSKCPRFVQEHKVQTDPCFQKDFNSFSIQNVSDDVVVDEDWSSEKWKNFEKSLFEISGSQNLVSINWTDSPIPKNSTEKHDLQHKAIWRVLEPFVPECDCFVELGAGKASLSYHISQQLKRPAKFVAIDFGSFKGKSDRDFRRDDVSIKRIRIDIKDIVLSRVPEIAASRKICLYSKHLCGSGTDLALKSIENLLQAKKDLIIGLVPCCHGKCIWSEFSNQEFFQQRNISSSDFKRLCQAGSWSCAVESSKLAISEDQRIQIGRLARRAINMARSEFISLKLETTAELVEFISPSVSPENLVLLANTSSEIPFQTKKRKRTRPSQTCNITNV